MESPTIQPSQTNRSCAGTRRSRPRSTRGFSLLELLIVIGVTMLLTAMLMPALRHVYENAYRVICMSHLQQIGTAMVMYTMHNNDRLPYSAALNVDGSPPELMTARRPGPHGGWDGLGLLFAANYCPAPACFYCPSHRGNHTYERYSNLWNDPTSLDPIYTNYHYAGDIEWQIPRRRTLNDGYALILATDGLRTLRDFNHMSGMNVLRGDGSVRWREDTLNIRDQLPVHEGQPPSTTYPTLWDLMQDGL